jgi:anti-anti-sigma regulatory factor
MLRITTTMDGDRLVMVLEGRLAGPWVDELSRCWTALGTTRRPASVAVVLDGVTFIDAAGRALLGAMRDEGTVLAAASGCMTRAIVQEIEERASRR